MKKLCFLATIFAYSLPLQAAPERLMKVSFPDMMKKTLKENKCYLTARAVRSEEKFTVLLDEKNMSPASGLVSFKLERSYINVAFLAPTIRNFKDKDQDPFFLKEHGGDQTVILTETFHPMTQEQMWSLTHASVGSHWRDMKKEDLEPLSNQVKSFAVSRILLKEATHPNGNPVDCHAVSLLGFHYFASVCCHSNSPSKRNQLVAPNLIKYKAPKKKKTPMTPPKKAKKP